MNEEEQIEIVKAKLSAGLDQLKHLQSKGVRPPKWARNRKAARREVAKQVAKELNYSTWWMPFVWWMLSTAVRRLIEEYLTAMFDEGQK